MKNLYLFLAATVMMSSASAQTMWDNFENERRCNYDFINGVFIPYNENPDQSGANTSQVAAMYTRNPAETFDVILMRGTMASVSPYVTGDKTMSMDVWSPAAGITVQITLENASIAQNPYPAGRHSEYTATTTTANAWETLTFQLSNLPDGGVAADALNQLVLLFNPNSNTGDTYYFDNVRGPEFANPPCEGVETNPEILNDFECNQNVNFIFSHSGINFRRIQNPDQSGNESSHVARYVRNGGEETDVIIGRFPAGPLQVGSSSEIMLDVWDPNAPTEVVVSLQTASGDVILAMAANTEVSSQWQTLSFDPSEVAGAPDIEQFVILFDPGNTTSDEYFFDNFIIDMPSSTADKDAVLSFTAFPNPSSGSTTFQYELREAAPVNFMLTDLTGKVIDQRALGYLPSGQNQFVYEPQGLSDGIYFYTFVVDGRTSTGKLVLNR